MSRLIKSPLSYKGVICNLKTKGDPARKIRLSKLDPTRTSALRRAFERHLDKCFSLLKGKLVALLVKQNIFGLPLTHNVWTDAARKAALAARHAKARELVHSLFHKSYHSLIKSHLKGIQVHESPEHLTRHLQKVHGKGQVDKAHRLASYDKSTGTLHISKDAPDSVVAHELGHVAEGPHSIYSRDPGFFHAWLKEGKGVSDYAQHSPEEGLAELFRLKHELGSKEAEKRAPRMVKALHSVAPKLWSHSKPAQTYNVDWNNLPIEKRNEITDSRMNAICKGEIVSNTLWQFNTASQKVDLFKQWLMEALYATFLSSPEEEMWNKYILDGFEKGAGRAFDDTRVSQRAKAGAEQKLDFYRGTREEFLRSSFAQPESIDKVKLLAGRTFDELKGVTSKMSLDIARTLTDGLVRGQNPFTIAKELNNQVDLGKQRCLIISRTEIVRAHAEGQLVAFKKLGVEELGVDVEWMDAGDERVCPKCKSLNGIIVKVSDASGLIPLHPQCRCIFSPANIQGKKIAVTSRDQTIKLIESMKTKRTTMKRVS